MLSIVGNVSVVCAGVSDDVILTGIVKKFVFISGSVVKEEVIAVLDLSD